MHLTPFLLSCLAVSATALPGASSGSGSSVTPSPGPSSGAAATPSNSLITKTSSRPRTTKRTKISSSTAKTTSSSKTTKSTKSTKTTTSKSSVRTDYEALCVGNALNKTLWDEFDISSYAVNLSNQISNGSSSYLDYVVSKTPGVLKFECSAIQDCILTPTDLGCNTDPGSKAAPFGYAIIYSIWYFRRWVGGMLRAIAAGQTSLASIQDKTFSFTSHNFTLAASTWKNSVVSGSMTAAGGVLAAAKVAFPELNTITFLSVGASLVGGFSTIDNGILSHLLSETVGVIENQLQEVAEMGSYLSDALNATYYGFVKWGNSFINGKVEQGGDYVDFASNNNGIVSWIKNGSFLQDITDDWQLSLNAKTVRSLTAAAVSDLWIQEEVFIVNTTNGWTWAWDNYTAEGLDIDKGDIERAYFDNQIFLFVKHSNGTAPSKAYDSVPGFADLPAVQLTPQDVINASAWSLNHVGFNKTWEPSLASSYLTSKNPPPQGLFMNIPICQLGQMPAPSADYFVGNDCESTKVAAECSLKKYINWSCSRQVQITNGKYQSWPYKMYDQ